jgi:hypothetical protein
MTVTRILEPLQYIGLSTDTKPTSGTPGSTFWAYDTNILFETPDGANWYTKEIRSIVQPTTIDLQQAAATYDLYTATGGTVYVESFTLTLPAVNVSDDINITSIAVATNTATVINLITSAAGAKANLTANASFSYSTLFALPVGKKIQLTIAGGAADAPTVCTVSCRYQAVTAAAYLA